MLAATLDDVDGLLAVLRNRRVFTHQLGIAQNAVERRAQLVADGADIAAFGLIRQVGRLPGALGHPFCGLQGLVGLPVRFDLDHQQMGLAIGLFLRHLAAFVRQHHPPGHQTGNHHQCHVGLEKARAQSVVRCLAQHVVGHGQRQCPQLLVIKQAKDAGKQCSDHPHQ
ncbi:hypothetical protein GALL_464580 [mine drainage metagenome]|uniref:Uncharacterized protein n=1 Tax=mine drainage metagenome TaxID=410659 RepID=A0A1J5PL93_9ZZZZ